MENGLFAFHLPEERRSRIWRQDMEGCAFETILFDPLGQANKPVPAILINSQNETAVDLDSILVEQTDAARIILRPRCAFARCRQVVVRERFKANEHA